MAQNIVNLQNTPEVKGVVGRTVSFNSHGAQLTGTLYTPTDAQGPLPAVIVTGAWTTVKEQMPATYAREIASRGVAALVFDFTGWGESGGEPRYVEDPKVKTADIVSAAHFLTTQEDVDASAISGLGVCASSGYMADAVANNSVFAKLALVAPWLHDPELATAVYGGPESVAGLIAMSEAEDAADNIMLGASTTDENCVMYQAPYYTETHRGLIKEYDNKFSVLSWKPWLTYDAQASADTLTKPTLLVGSSAIALPAGVEAYEARTKAPLEKLWLGDDVTQFDFYDRKDAVTAASDAVADFIKG